MNRGRSSDSLDNESRGVISSGSSSPTDFTSDDENGADNFPFMCRQPLKNINKPRSSHCGNHHQINNKTDGHGSNRNHIDFSLPSRHNLRHTSAHHRPILTANNQNHLTGIQLNYIDNCTIEPSMASTSYYDDHLGPNCLTSNVDMLSSRLPDVVHDPTSLTLISDQAFGHRYNNQIDSVNSHRSIGRHRRVQPQRGQSSNGLASRDNGENYGSPLADDDDDDDGVELFGRQDACIEPAIQAIAGPSRGMNTISVRLCARLVECRSLIEAIEFIDQNRDLIDSLTRIVTRDAPAFRNYNLSDYQIDHSVKESFNPNFWLDREPIVTTADGNCQYHAVSLSLTGSELHTQEVRLATAVAVIDNREYFDSMLKLIDRGTVLDLVHTIARSYSWGDETTLKAIAVAIKRRIFLYTCNIGKKDYEMVKLLSEEELLDAFKEKKYRGGTGIHTYADPLTYVAATNYIMLFHKSEHFIAVLPMNQQPTMFEPYNPIVPVFS